MNRKMIALFWLMLAGCASIRSPQVTDGTQQITDPTLITKRPQPVKIFGIGHWSEGYMILTLVDADHRYLIATVKRNDNLKIGGVYTP